MVPEDSSPDIVMITDEDGCEYMFEALDRVKTDDGHYVALAPLYDNDDDAPEDDEFIVLEVEEENGETFLTPIEDEALLEELGTLFEERLAEIYGAFDGDDEENDGGDEDDEM
ncbi:MAG: DUF1292 domain-containing protein [Oscillospiraceae bacterium]|jgi:uncharacterized protein YrzB (UPF0473 family)|nr:DUF1292 domain-containing protein [Oscillospiraceae bacterium]